MHWKSTVWRWSWSRGTLMLNLLMYKFITKKFRFETGTETRLQSPKRVDEVSSPKLPLAHEVEVVARFKTLNLVQTSHCLIHLSFEWIRFTAGKLLQNHWHLEVIKLCGNKHSCLLNFLLLESRIKAPLSWKLALFPDIQPSTDRTSYLHVMNF
jgi:hypothetical protein